MGIERSVNTDRTMLEAFELNLFAVGTQAKSTKFDSIADSFL